MNLAEILDEEILPLVEKPSRYLGNELNAVHKDRSEVEVRMALAFPDLYDIGLGNLGLHILYAAINALPWAWAERVYAPGLDMERELRARNLPMFGLESKDPLSEMDLLGFTLQTELTYTNILNLLDLAEIPLRWRDRTDAHPLICAGGPAVFNPEPLAPFVDFFVIGDGEAAIVEVAEVLRRMKGRPRKAKLFALSLLEGVYVPALYPFDTTPEGRVVPKEGAPKVRRRLTRDLDGSTFPVDYVVPFTQQVHDRVSLEVLRGCTHGCRFCQAGMTSRPVRQRSLSRIDELMKRTLDATGYEEVSLVSLSTCDHSQVRQVVQNAVEVAKPRRVSVALPSLRLDSYSVELADMVAETRRTGLTVAPEAASPRLRAVINKWIPDEELLRMSNGAFERGWSHVKLYFMIGLPTERDDDIVAIADLARRTVEEGKAFSSKARVNLGVSTFVPKPFTPFQWAAQIPMEETVRRQEVLGRALAGARDVKFGRHDPEETFLEGLISRGDRRVGDLLEAAFRKGCRFDAWREHLRFDLWLEAIEETGFDVADALRERSVDERLPWDHIDVLVKKEWLREDWQRALELKHAQDCRHRKCHQCGVIDRERELCSTMLKDHGKARREQDQWVREPVPAFEEPPPVQRLWIRISRTGASRYLSHLESMNAWLRALRRAGAPLSYSQGFHPHPRVAFSTALPQGEESLGDYMDIVLHERVDPARLLARLADRLPDGFGAHAITEVPLQAPSLMAMAQGVEYTLIFPDMPREELAARVEALLAQPTIEVARKGKMRKGRRREKVENILDIKPMIRSLGLREGPLAAVDLGLVAHEGKPGKAREIVALLAPEQRVRVIKRETLVEREGNWAPLETPEWSRLSTPRASAVAEASSLAP